VESLRDLRSRSFGVFSSQTALQKKGGIYLPPEGLQVPTGSSWCNLNLIIPRGKRKTGFGSWNGVDEGKKGHNGGNETDELHDAVDKVLEFMVYPVYRKNCMCGM
jgi:hypothetical protein